MFSYYIKGIFNFLVRLFDHRELLTSSLNTCRHHWLLDPARLVILAISLWLITHASQRAVKLDKTAKDDLTWEGKQVHLISFRAPSLPAFHPSLFMCWKAGQSSGVCTTSVLFSLVPRLSPPSQG